MRSINKVILIGNLTRDPETRQTPNGQFVATFGLATNRAWVTSGNSRQTSTEFHELVAWAKLAEICQKNIKKGKLVYVEGYLKTRSWDTPEGIKRFKTEIIVQDLIILEKRPREENGDGEYIPEEMETNHAPAAQVPLATNINQSTATPREKMPVAAHQPSNHTNPKLATSSENIDDISIESDLNL